MVFFNINFLAFMVVMITYAAKAEGKSERKEIVADATRRFLDIAEITREEV